MYRPGVNLIRGNDILVHGSVFGRSRTRTDVEGSEPVPWNSGRNVVLDGLGITRCLARYRGSPVNQNSAVSSFLVHFLSTMVDALPFLNIVFANNTEIVCCRGHGSSRTRVQATMFRMAGWSTCMSSFFTAVVLPNPGATSDLFPSRNEKPSVDASLGDSSPDATLDSRGVKVGRPSTTASSDDASRTGGLCCQVGVVSGRRNRAASNFPTKASSESHEAKVGVTKTTTVGSS